MDDKMKSARRDVSVAQAYAAYLLALAARKQSRKRTVIANVTPKKEAGRG